VSVAASVVPSWLKLRSFTAGLTATRWADDPEQRRADEPRDQLGDQSLSTEEELGVIDVEARETLERAHDSGTGGGLTLRALAHGLQLDDAARQLLLSPAQIAALRSRAIGRYAQSTLGLRARPLRSQAMR
jgi:hypothetical protein